MPSQLEEMLELFLHRGGKIYIENSSGFPSLPLDNILITEHHTN